ncbi:protein adenylyltransferase Fic-like [Paramacrobiotus metropolitanus]|uniref:protein adenylyltransferase Fic-like n=1 Tax=Paramacrobiotus metropolitanus TaxID=2943436 RepID=UPI0024460E83|nr:protein adenylyltransferase Fic-like [Paramacrobiotus metropolitanus]
MKSGQFSLVCQQRSVVFLVTWIVLCLIWVPLFTWTISALDPSNDVAVLVNESGVMAIRDGLMFTEDRSSCNQFNPETAGTFHTEFGTFMTTGTTTWLCRGPAVIVIAPEMKKEATAALHVALEMKYSGKIRKASKLFQHAVALDPSNSEILTEYGTFLEEHQKDVLKADNLYLRAVHADPKNHRALTLRVRTQPLVEEIDQKAFDRIDSMMHEFYGIPQWDAMMIRKKRAAFLWQLYHSVAIEGNTLSFLETKQVVETRLAVGGKSVMEHNEILGMDEALKYLNETLLMRIGPIRMMDILDMHLRILGFNDPVNAGKFRKSQVFVSDHIPPLAEDVPLLMEEFVDWLNSDDAAQMHTLKLAALAHYFLVHIHPFVDGNGRVGRLLMNYILMRSGIPPVVIRVSERNLYYQHLKDANAGDIRPFIRFITKCTEMTLNEYLYAANDMEMFAEYPTLPGDEDNGKIILPGPSSLMDLNSGFGEEFITSL